jgi:hypothetical protein
LRVEILEALSCLEGLADMQFISTHQWTDADVKQSKALRYVGSRLEIMKDSRLKVEIKYRAKIVALES